MAASDEWSGGVVNVTNAVNRFGDAVEDLDTLLAQYARVQRELAAVAAHPAVLAFRDAERARTNLEAAIKEEAHKRRDSVSGHGYVVKVTPRTSVQWMTEILAERAPWLVDAGYIIRSVAYVPDKKRLDKLAGDDRTDGNVRDLLLACRSEEPLTPAVTIGVDAETLLRERAS